MKEKEKEKEKENKEEEEWGGELSYQTFYKTFRIHL